MGDLAQADYVVVGGGIVGAATARELILRRPGSRVVLLEKENTLGSHQTGHNSGVIHSGIYYQPGSLKAELCRRGAAATKKYAEQAGIAWQEIGKLLVATTGVELEAMEALARRAERNQISFHRLSAGELREREPHVTGLGALEITTTGITDFGAITAALANDLVGFGGEVRLSNRLVGIRELSDRVLLHTDCGTLAAKRAVFCAGIQADRVAGLGGLPTDFAMIPFRGEYYDVVPAKRDLVARLIYPVPDPGLPFLGVHLTPTVDGSLTVGPNAVLGLAREGYPRFSFDRRDARDIVRFPGAWRVARANLRTGARELFNSLSKRGYLRLCQKYCPSLTLDDLVPREAGIRAQAVLADGSFVHDFMLRRTPRQLHVINAPSPAATSALPIAARIADEVLGPDHR